MKAIKNYILILIGALILSSCGYDNYDGPNAIFKGRLVYQGTPLNLDFRDVNMELWEPGWEKKNKINVHVDQNGEFSAALFNGSYKLFIPRNPVPFKTLVNSETNSDTILVEIRGNKQMDIEVMPYYLVKSSTITNTGRTINASCALEKIITDGNAKNIERVTLYVSKSNLVSSRNDVGGTVSVDGGNITDLNSINLSRTVQDLTPAQPYVFARIGVKLAGADYMIFSPIQKIDF